MTSARCCGLFKSSTGWLVNRTGVPAHAPTAGEPGASVSAAVRSHRLSCRQHSAGRQAKHDLDQRHLELREALEHAPSASGSTACFCMPGTRHVVLPALVSRPAGPVVSVAAAEALHVQRDRAVAALGRLVDRPVAPVAERIAGPRLQDALPERRVNRARATLDLGDGGRRVLGGDHDAGAQPERLCGLHASELFQSLVPVKTPPRRIPGCAPPCRPWKAASACRPRRRWR